MLDQVLDSSEKPRVQIKDCFILEDRLYGVTLDHPNPHGLVTNGGIGVITSPIVKHHSTRCIETRNTMYEVLNWKTPDSISIKPQ